MATRDAPDKAIHFFERALATDKDYAEALGRAWARRTRSRACSSGCRRCWRRRWPRPTRRWRATRSLPEGLRRPRQRAVRAGPARRGARVPTATAIALDPKNARAHAQLARVHWVGRGDLRAGIAELERAVAINPQFGYAHHQLAYSTRSWASRQGREPPRRRPSYLQEQYISGEEGFLVIGAHTRLGYVFYRQGRYEEALAEYQTELLFLSSSDHVLKDRSLVELHQKLGAALVRLGRADEGAPSPRSLPSASTRSAPGSARSRPQPQYYVAAAYAAAGQRWSWRRRCWRSRSRKQSGTSRARGPRSRLPAAVARHRGHGRRRALEGLPPGGRGSTTRPTRLSDRARGRRTSAARAR